MMEQALIVYVANAIWRIPLIAIGAALLARFGRLGPLGRHRVWLAALVLAVVLPALPGVGVFHFASPVSNVLPPPAAVETATRPASAPVVPPMAVDAGAGRLIAGAFAAMVAFSLLRLILAWRGAVRLARDSDRFTPAPAVQAALVKMARAHEASTPSIRISTEVRGPVVTGVFRPVILAPPAFRRLSEDEQTAALLHELAHIIRHDFAANLLCEAVALPGSWHPVIYEIKAGVRRSRELVCDAMASDAIQSRHDYARRLLALAKAFGPQPQTGAVMVGLIGASTLEERLMHLISGEYPRAGGRARLAAAGLLAGAVLAPALLLHVDPAFARSPSPPSPPPLMAPAAPPVPAATPVAPRLRVEVTRPRRLKLARAEVPAPAVDPAFATPPVPPLPPVPPAAPPGPPAPPAPPRPPAPPAPPMPDMRQIEAMVDRALAQSDVARDAFVKARLEAAMAALQAHQSELSTAERERVMAEVRQGAEAWKRQHMAETMAGVRRQVHAALESAEAQRALASDEVRRALHEAVKAADEAYAAHGENPPN